MRETKEGSPLRLGAHIENGWWNFAIYSPNTISSLVLGDYATGMPFEELILDRIHNRTGDIWHIAVKASEERLRWGWRVPSRHKKRAQLAVDPYAKFLFTENSWGKNGWERLSTNEYLISTAVQHTAYPWKENNWTPHRPADLIIYEAHVRGFTRDPSSKTLFPGSFLAMADKVSHIKKLGMTAVELMPLHEFNEAEWKKRNASQKTRLYNYWGYSPLHFFSPMNRYGTTHDPVQTSVELKELISACHDEGLAVILDVVYNHTGEGNEHGPAYSFKLLAEDTYYIKNRERFENFSGCGNTFNVNHPVVSSLVLDSLRHMVLEYHVDGFRFDLAPILTRDQLGAPMEMPPIIEAIVRDPIIGKCMLIAEPWDASGLYQTGSFFQLNQCRLPFMCEWNDKFRDDVRQFFKGTPRTLPRLATRMSGSQDLYGGGGGSPKNSINFITCHDGFSLYDLVSYNVKHNEANGEDNRDGMNENYSWNCGHEGETKSRSVLRLRDKQIKNMLIALFLSQGSPLFLMGDECKSTRCGNNNTWCQDSPLSWLNWDDIEKSEALQQSIKVLLDLRARSGCFTKKAFLTPDDIDWHGESLSLPDWEKGYGAFSLKNEAGTPLLFIGYNATSLSRTIEVPVLEEDWRIVADTAKSPPKDFFFIEKGPLFTEQEIALHRFSSVVLAHPSLL